MAYITFSAILWIGSFSINYPVILAHIEKIIANKDIIHVVIIVPDNHKISYIVGTILTTGHYLEHPDLDKIRKVVSQIDPSGNQTRNLLIQRSHC